MDDPEFVQANINRHPVISIKLPRSLQRVKQFEKWRENLKEYFGELSDNFFDCLKDVDKMSPIEVLNFIIDHLHKENEEKPVIILIDNFDSPLIAALKGGIINEAYEYYGTKVFPLSLVSNPKVFKIVSVGMLQVEIPESIFCLDSMKESKSNVSLIKCLNQQQKVDKKKPYFGFSESELFDLMAKRHGID